MPKLEDLVRVTMRSSLPTNSYDPQPEPLRFLRCSASHIAESNDDDGLTGNRRSEYLRPKRSALVCHDLRHTRIQHQQCHRREFSGLLHMDSTIVRQRHPFRQPIKRQQRLDPCPCDMDPLEIWCCRSEVVQRKTWVRHHVVRAYEGRCRRERGTVCKIFAERAPHAGRYLVPFACRTDELGRDVEHPWAVVPCFEMDVRNHSCH